MFSVHGQGYDVSKDIQYYMMDVKDVLKLPVESGRTYISSDEKVVVIKGNRKLQLQYLGKFIIW
jgi:hypothetical protein